MRWLFWDNHKLTGYMASYRFMRTFIPVWPIPQVLKYYRKRLDDFLGILETHLQQNAFAIGARPTIADISMMAYLHYPSDETGYDFAASHPAISAWLGRMAALPGWKSRLRSAAGQAADALRELTAQRLNHAQTMPKTITPAMTVTAIAQLLTRTLLTISRLASFSAISRFRCLFSWSEELIAGPRSVGADALCILASNDDGASALMPAGYRPFTKHMPMREVLPAT